VILYLPHSHVLTLFQVFTFNERGRSLVVDPDVVMEEWNGKREEYVRSAWLVHWLSKTLWDLVRVPRNETLAGIEGLHVTERGSRLHVTASDLMGRAVRVYLGPSFTSVVPSGAASRPPHAVLLGTPMIRAGHVVLNATLHPLVGYHVFHPVRTWVVYVAPVTDPRYVLPITGQATELPIPWSWRPPLVRVSHPSAPRGR
jgi:hypothetical protein